VWQLRVSLQQPLASAGFRRLRTYAEARANITFGERGAVRWVELKSATPVADGGEIELHCDAAKAKPGTKGNLIFDISTERKPPPSPDGRPPTASASPWARSPPCPSKS